jgi:hypothetical protein
MNTIGSDSVARADWVAHADSVARAVSVAHAKGPVPEADADPLVEEN